MALWVSQGEEQNVSLWPLEPCVDRSQLRSPASLSPCSPCFLSRGYTMFLSFLECTRLLAPSHSLSQCCCFCGSHRLLSCSLPGYIPSSLEAHPTGRHILPLVIPSPSMCFPSATCLSFLILNRLESLRYRFVIH